MYNEYYIREAGHPLGAKIKCSMPTLNSSDLSGCDCNSHRVGDGRRSLALVVFIGGVTYAEISALRFLSSQVFWKSVGRAFL